MAVCCPAPGADVPVVPLTGDEARHWITRAGPGRSRIEFIVPEANCVACIGGIEPSLNAVPGVVSARVNLTAQRVAVVWRDGEAEPQDFMQTLADLGYTARPFDPRENGILSEQEEGKALLRALAVAGFAACNIMLLSVSVWSGAEGATRDLFHWISALIALPTVIYAGRPFFTSAMAALRHGRVNMDVPISLGVLLATVMSLYETLHHAEHAFFDAAVTLLFFLLAGRTLDHMMRARARSAISNLTLLMPQVATIIENGMARIVPAAALKKDMTLLVAVGERLAADGVVAEGVSELDRSVVTGESVPEVARPGTEVQSGTMNLSAPLTVRITATGEDTFIAELMRLMAVAEQSQSRYVQLADRLARHYAPTVHTMAGITLLGWLLYSHNWHTALMNAIAVLIITCPCALGLAVPAVQVVATGLLFRRGVMVKDGAVLEKLSQVDTVVFDKTGTLTLGHPVLLDAASVPPELLALAAGLAQHSRHPLSKAVVRAASAAAVTPAAVSDVREIPGSGLEAMVGGETVRLGHRLWCGLAEAPDAASMEFALTRQGRLLHLFAFEDELRPEAAATIRKLTASGLKVMLLSGDRPAAVTRLAKLLGIEDYHARQTPEEKLSRVSALQAEGRKVLMVGDGINDAPALAAGFTSMAPATASDIGRTAADTVFLGHSLLAVADARALAAHAQRTVKQNFILALLYNALAVPIAVMGFVTPLIAAVAMSTSSILVVANALLLGWRAPLSSALPAAEPPAGRKPEDSAMMTLPAPPQAAE